MFSIKRSCFLIVVIVLLIVWPDIVRAERKTVNHIRLINDDALRQTQHVNHDDVFDTLSYFYDEPLGYFDDPFQRLVEAVKLKPQSKCRLHSIYVAFYNEINGTMSKDVEFYLWKNGQKLPGNLLYRTQKRVRMNTAGFEWIKIDFSDTLIYLDNDFWIGHKELTSGFPTSVIDSKQTVDATNFYAENGIEWFEEDYDYLQLAIVQYSEFGDPKIVITPDTLVFQVTTGSDPDDDDDDRSPEIGTIQRSLSVSYLENEINGIPDTLSNEYIPPFYPFYEKYRTAYEATKFFASRPAVVKKLLIAFMNSDNEIRSKQCEFFIWKDVNDQPGKILFGDSMTVSLPPADITWEKFDFSDKPITVSGNFWIGHRELTNGYPTSLVDESATPGANYTSTDGTFWSAEDYDYLQKVIVDYQADPLEGMSQFIIYNLGTYGLQVSRIYSDQSWVCGIGPSVFAVAVEDSQIVQVYINARGIDPGIYAGRLIIESNDPSAPLAEKPIQLKVYGPTRVSQNLETYTPGQSSLIGNYPNPFNPSTKIDYQIHRTSYVILNIYNIRGQLVASLINRKHDPGKYFVNWDGNDKNGNRVPNGVYFCRMNNNYFEQTIKMTLLR